MQESPNLDEIEEKTRNQTRKREQQVLTVIEQLLNLYLSAFQQIGEFTITDDNRREQVWLRLTARAFNSLGQAFRLLQSGYYSQALILTRSAQEDWLACMDSKAHEQTIEALLSKGKRVPPPKCMANRLPADLKNEWNDIDGEEGLYGFLSTFSHPRWRSAAVVINPESKTLLIGPQYDETLFIVSAFHVLHCGMRVMEFLTRLVDNPTEPDWAKKNATLARQGETCRKALFSRAETLLKEDRAA